jgi:uncharacterized protein (TIGR00162 family)
MVCAIEIDEKPVLNDPVLIEGLPGIGFVANIAALHLTRELKAKRFASIVSASFQDFAVTTETGGARSPTNELYYCKNARSKNDLIVFTGNTQAVSPEGQYEVANETITQAKRLGVVKLFATAAYVVEKPVETPTVHGAASDVTLIEELKQFGVVPMDTGSITGTNGLLFGVAALQNIPSICLLSETPAYAMPTGRFVVDAKATKALLEVLTRILGIEIDMKPLDEQAKLSEEVIRRMEEIEQRTIDEVRKAAASRAPKGQMYT